jgi:glucan biosynthesis protein C
MATQTVSIERAKAQRSAVEGRSSVGFRLAYVDNLRILLSILVILHHLAIGYGADGGWYYKEEGTITMLSAVLLTLFAATNQAFFMGFFFMLSSYFGVRSYERKGAGLYLVDRLKRLGIPLLLYPFTILPLIGYVVYYRAQGSFLQFLPRYLADLKSLADSPLWFVEALLVFSFVYALWRLLPKPASAAAQVDVPKDSQVPGNLTIALFALGLGLVTFVVRIWLPIGYWFEPLHWQLAHWPQYIALYVLGIVAYRRNWFEGLSAAQGKLWMRVVLILLPLFPAVAIAGGALEGDLTPFKGGIYWQSLAFSIWEQFMCMAMVVTLLVWYRNRFNHQGRLAGAMSADAYAVYVFMAPVVVLLAVALRDIQLEMGLKFVLVAPVAVAFTFLAGHCARKLPLARSVL